VAQAKPSKRTYNSSRRQLQAAGTRQAILEAAEGLFLRDGYPATTMEAIASEAGVALKTVYLPFTTKSGLLRALWDLRLKGEPSDAPVVESDWVRDILNEDDPVRKLQLDARGFREVKTRMGGIMRVIRGAAEIDPDCSALWELIQSDFYDIQAKVVGSLRRTGALRPGLNATRATDILWTLHHPDNWILLVWRRGWTPAAYEAWLGETSCAQLLGTAIR
jgi:AcrR family transcriptional regulator